MRIDVVDPSAYTPPYDHELCAALARAGAQPRLVTSAFVHGASPDPDGYRREEYFYRRAIGAPGSRLRRATKLGQHVPDMLRYRRTLSREADVVHFQWLAVQQLDARLLPRGRPLAITAHDVLPREPRRGQLIAQRRLYEHFDAVVVHSRHGRRRLIEELGVAPERVHEIEHGAMGLLARTPQAPLPAELGATAARAPVVLCFGLLRPYKGIDVLLDAWRAVECSDAELWIVGAPRFDLDSLRADAPANVRWVVRYVSDGELAACFARADVVVLPYRDIDQSGVVFTALAFGKAIVASDVGGFPELAERRALEVVPAGDPAALSQSLNALIDDQALRERLAAGALSAARGRYSWDAVAARTLDLYRRLLAV